MKRTLGVVMLAVLMLTGCPPGMTETDRLAVAHATFAGTVNSLTALVEAGVFDATEVDQIAALVSSGAEMLARWEAAIELGQETDSLVQTWNLILRELRTAQLTAERRQKESGDGPDPDVGVPGIGVPGDGRAAGCPGC